MQDPVPPGREGPVSIFEDIRRQVEEMMSGRRPPGPQIITQRPAAPSQAPEAPSLGFVATTVGAYWIAAIAAGRRRRRLMNAQKPPADDQPQA